MYTMVLMMAASSAGESPDFFRRGGSCTGSTVAAAPAGCTGTVMAAPTGCSGTSASCHGGSGFLGLRAKLFGGGHSCHGTVSAPAMSGCHGTVFAPAMSSGCTGGTGGTVSAPAMMMSDPVGCAPSMGTVMMPGTPVVTPPVTMPEVPKKDPKDTDPKKDPEVKKGSEL